ncbi:MAG: TlpA disulfide reductase family protein [Myxococcota bacterium]
MLALGLLFACTTAPAPESVVSPVPEPGVDGTVAPSPGESLAGTGPFGIQLGDWEGRFATQGGPLRFRMRVDSGCRTTLMVAGQEIEAFAQCEANTLSVRFPPYLGSLTATIGEGGDTLLGQYDFQRSGEWHHLPFEASRALEPVWIAPPEGAPATLSLQVDGKSTVLLETREHEGRTYASVSAPTGDWGPLEGGWTPEGLELSGFDGSHAFLVKLAPDDAGRMVGTVWSRDADGKPLVETEEQADLDGWNDLDLASVDFTGLSLPRIGGATEPLPTDRPRIVHLTGSWCPNCNDAAPVIEALARDFPEVVVLGLSWEAGAPPGKADRQIQRFNDRHGVSHAMYRLDAAPPFLDPVPAWPTTLFVRADGTVQAAHVGFLGPSTGTRHTALVERMRSEAGKLAGRSGG